MNMVLVRGVEGVVQKLREAERKVAAEFEGNLKRAGLFLQAESQKVVPVDTGNLKNSAFTRAEGKGLDAKVWVGYTASYGVYVHEIIENKHAPGKMAKFLETPLREKRETILAMIAGKK